MVEAEEIDGVEFKWGKKRGIGGKKKDVQFYESFTYGGEEYILYDSVYMFGGGEREPYIGKIIKIWENADKTKKVKVLWFFRPCEIRNFLGEKSTHDSELFLASGDGLGLTNVNPLEAIAGKCFVLCISKDVRNPQPSSEELQMADFIFYRTFDVVHQRILDEMGEKIAGIDVKYLLNRADPGKICVSSHSKDKDKKDVIGNAIESTEAANPIKEKSTKENANLRADSLPKDNADQRAPLLDQSLKRKRDSTVEGEIGKMAKSNAEQENFLNEKLSPRSGVDYDRTYAKVVRSPVKGVGIKDTVKRDGNLLELDQRSAKKVKHECSVEVPADKDKCKLDQSSLNNKNNEMKALPTKGSAREGNSQFKIGKDSERTENRSSKKLTDEKFRELSNGKTSGTSPRIPSENKKIDGEVVEVTRRPDADRSRWFRALPWEERMKSSHEQGTLVLIQNLDPSYTSAEVEDIVWHAFKESCTAKMVQRTAFSSPHCGKAFVIFKTKEAAGKVVKKLDQGCLLLPNGRPLVGSFANPSFPSKKSIFFGHLFIEKLRHQTQREMREAVSTSHCSQPNTIAYDMAMEWCLLHERSDRIWKNLYKQQGEELKRLVANMKSR